MTTPQPDGDDQHITARSGADEPGGPDLAVVTPAGRRRACPRCGSRSIARIQYGFPVWSDELGAQLASGTIRLGGCVVHPLQPDLACNSCGCEFTRDGTIIGPKA